jgi:hypothetical protein
LLITAALGTFLLVAPVTRYPLAFDQAISVLQVIMPLFVGYLSTAIVFVTTMRAPTHKGPKGEFNSLLVVLIKGPLYLVAGLLAVSFVVFGASNWPTEGSPTSGFEFGLLSNLISFILSISSATTSALVAWLFKVESENAN